jgi:hypothetical protein
VWSRNKANLYIQDALDDFHYDPKALPSPIAQRKIYRNKLMLTHLIGFGGGGGAAAGVGYDLTGSNHLTAPDHADWTFGSSNFTVEGWFRFPNSLGGTDMFITHADIVGDDAGWEFLINTTTVPYHHDLRFRYSLDGSLSSGWHQTVEREWGLSLDTWYHLAAARSSTNLHIFVDGVQQGATADVSTDTFYNSTVPLYISGGEENGAPANYFDGYVDEIRISDIARYTTGFTPSSTQFTSDANTLLLIHCGEAIASGTTGSGATFVDSGNTGHTVTENGNAIRDTSIYKF